MIHGLDNDKELPQPDRETEEQIRARAVFPRPGWHWWDGRGNDRQVDGSRPVAIKHWCVYVWYFAGRAYASSACWVEPLPVSEMGGEWLGELVPPNTQRTTDDPRMDILRSLPIHVVVNWIIDAVRNEIGICASTFALGMDSRFRDTSPLEMFDLCAAVIREKVAARQNNKLTNEGSGEKQ